MWMLLVVVVLVVCVILDITGSYEVGFYDQIDADWYFHQETLLFPKLKKGNCMFCLMTRLKKHFYMQSIIYNGCFIDSLFQEGRNWTFGLLVSNKNHWTDFL